jgi:hypothetical protein
MQAEMKGEEVWINEREENRGQEGRMKIEIVEERNEENIR